MSCFCCVTTINNSTNNDCTYVIVICNNSGMIYIYEIRRFAGSFCLYVNENVKITTPGETSNISPVPSLSVYCTFLCSQNVVCLDWERPAHNVLLSHRVRIIYIHMPYGLLCRLGPEFIWNNRIKSSKIDSCVLRERQNYDPN